MAVVGAGALSSEEIAKRLPVWCALWELFLDTELQSADFDRIAGALMEAKISESEGERILHNEVAPAFVANTLSVAGEWAGWPDFFVKERMVKFLDSGTLRRAIAALRARLHRNQYALAWKQVAIRLNKMENTR